MVTQQFKFIVKIQPLSKVTAFLTRTWVYKLQLNLYFLGLNLFLIYGNFFLKLKDNFKFKQADFFSLNKSPFVHTKSKHLIKTLKLTYTLSLMSILTYSHFLRHQFFARSFNLAFIASCRRLASQTLIGFTSYYSCRITYKFSAAKYPGLLINQVPFYST